MDADRQWHLGELLTVEKSPREYRKRRKDLRKTLIQRVKLVDPVSGEGPVVAELEWRRGAIRQKFRNQWIGLTEISKLRSTEVVSHIAELTAFRILDRATDYQDADIIKHAIKELREHWLDEFDVEPLLIECFPDRVGIDGPEVLKDWKNQGPSSGYLHQTREAKREGKSVSDLWMKELVCGGIRNLLDETPQLEFAREILESLVERFQEISDPRNKRSRIYPAGALLALICLSRHAGSKSIRGHCKWARDLNQEQLEALGLGKIPTHHVLSDFVNSMKKTIPQSIQSRSSDLGVEFIEEMELTTIHRARGVEARIMCEFNDWLQEHGRKKLVGRLWSDRNEMGKKDNASAARKKSKNIALKNLNNRPLWATTIADEKKYSAEIAAERKQSLSGFTDRELWRLAKISDSFKDSRGDRESGGVCPFDALVAIMGLGRLYVKYDARKLWLWCYRLSEHQLFQIGSKWDAAIGRAFVPNRSTIKDMMDRFGESNWKVLAQRVAIWVKRWEKSNYIRKTGGVVPKD